ncbi:MAG: asparagine synthetase B family protein, partial [Candidatus Hermodarchaeota archaeon]
KLPKYQPDRNLGILIDEGKKLLKDATKLRLIADVPIGAFLSGGLDSSATVATMSNFLELKNLNTFSIGFSGSYDETKYSSIIKDFFNTKHHYKFFNKNDFEKLLNTIFYFYDEPFADHSIFPTIAVSKLASDFVKVVLTGDGGDEIFGGYDKYQAAAQIAILRKMPKLVRKLGYRLIPKSIESSISTFRYLKEGIKISLKPPEDYFTELWSEEVYKPEIYKQWTQMKLKHCLDLSNGNFTEALIKYDYYFSTMAENFLLKVDRASMAHSVETRSPFLDYRFIDYSTKIPVEMKTNYKKRKILMREIIKDLVPEEIVKRGKKGFEPPIIEWIMKEKYLTEIKRRIDELHNREILNDNWKDFYDRIYVKKKKSLIDTWYLVRMFLFGRWVDQWFSKT